MLARLDPPEAYLTDETSGEPEHAASRVSPHPRINPLAERRKPRASIASGILGLVVVFLVLLSPLPYFVGLLLQSEFVMIFGWATEILAVVAAGVLGICLGIYSRFKDGWAIMGVVACSLSVAAAFIASAILLAPIVGNL